MLEIFKSKEQKEREAEEKQLEEQVRLRRTQISMKKFDKTMDRKKDEMIQKAQEAKQQGLTPLYNQALNAIKMIIRSQNQCKMMAMQLDVVQTIHDITDTTGDFFQTIGSVGMQLDNLTRGMNISGNQLEFEKGMVRAQQAMDQLEQCLESTGLQFDDMTEDELTEQVEHLVDAATIGENPPVDDEIADRLAELKKKQSGLA